MPASNLTTEEREQAFAIRHSSWNRIAVLLGPDAEDRATRLVVDSVLVTMDKNMEDLPHSAMWCASEAIVEVKPTQEQYNETYEWLQEHDYLNDWDVFDEARIHGDDE